MLHGPAHADHYRVKVGRYGVRWYTDPLPACPIAPASDWHGPSVSATKPPFANKYVPMRSIADMTTADWRRLAELDPNERYEHIKTHDKTTSRINMNRGSIVHAWAEDLLAGRPMIDPIGEDRASVEQAEQFKPALQAFFDAHQPEPVAVEVPCMHRDLNGVGYGGTADVFARIDGDIWAIDWKSRTSEHGAYLEEAAQGGAYCGAQYMIIDHDGTPVRTAIPDVAGVLIVSITRDGYRAYPIDRDGAIAAYRSMHAWWVAQRQFTDAKVIGRPWAPRAAKDTTCSVDSSVNTTAGGSLLPSEARTSPSSTSSPTTNSPTSPGVSMSSSLRSTFATTEAPSLTSSGATPADRDRLRARIAELITNGHETTVRRLWPAGIAPLSKPGHTDDELAQILAAVRRAETETSTTFHPDDTEPPATVTTADEPAPAPVPDDSDPADTTMINTLEARFAALNASQRAAVAQIAAEANAAGRSISVAQRPSRRRALIASAIIDWAHTDITATAALFSTVAAIATPEQTADPDITLGALLGDLNIDQALSLRDTLHDSVAA